VVARELFPNDELMRDNLKRALYLFNSEMDFISEVSSRKHIQSLMNTVFLSDSTYQNIGVKKNKSILQSIFSSFASFFNSIIEFFNGNAANSKSVLEAVMLQNMMITNELSLAPQITKGRDIGEKYSIKSDADSQALSGTIRDFLNKSTKAEREAFRFSLSRNIFKTKC
jgi:hypothetical protein